MLRRLLPFASIVLLSACSLSPGGLSEQEVSAAMPTAGEIGRGWELVGTTNQRPQESAWDDALTEAAADQPGCRSALTSLEADLARPEPARFIRSVYRHQTEGAASDRDLTLTVETFDQAPDRPTAIRAMTAACTKPLKTRAGVRTVTMSVKGLDEGATNTAGYSVTYETAGLAYSFDYVLARQDRAIVAASVTGPSSEANEQLLRQAIRLAGANLDRARGSQPTP